MPAFPRRGLKAVMAPVSLLALSACTEPLDFDLRGLGNGLDTTEAVQAIADRPRPDANGVITYPTYQVAVARRGETVNQIGGRLGYDGATLARLNGVAPDTPLRRGEIVALPNRAAITTSRAPNPGPATAPAEVNVTTLAGDAIERADPANSATPAPTPAVQPGPEPIRHQVERGETAYTIARLYNVPVTSLARWNGLGADFLVREGQQLLIPVEAVTATPIAAETTVTAPGTGSATPAPPSASDPLPDEAAETTTPAEDTATPAQENLAEERTDASATDKPFLRPVEGSIIRAYARGRNEGIDIAAPAGTPVRAAESGSVAAVSQDTNGVTILVLRHADGLLTVYTNLDELTVARGDTVRRGQALGKVREGNPSFVHFEVRRGLESVDPADFVP